MQQSRKVSHIARIQQAEDFTQFASIDRLHWVCSLTNQTDCIAIVPAKQKSHPNLGTPRESLDSDISLIWHRCREQVQMV